MNDPQGGRPVTDETTDDGCPHGVGLDDCSACAAEAMCAATPDAEPDVFEMFHRHALEVRQAVEIMRASRDHMDSDDRHTLDGATAAIDDLFHHDDTPAPLRMPRFLAEPKSGAAEPIRINRAAPVEAETPAPPLAEDPVAVALGLAEPASPDVAERAADVQRRVDRLRNAVGLERLWAAITSPDKSS